MRQKQKEREAVLYIKFVLARPAVPRACRIAQRVYIKEREKANVCVCVCVCVFQSPQSSWIALAVLRLGPTTSFPPVACIILFNVTTNKTKTKTKKARDERKKKAID